MVRNFRSFKMRVPKEIKEMVDVLTWYGKMEDVWRILGREKRLE